MSVASSLSDVLRRRRVQVAVAVIALGGAVTAVAVANVALLDVAGRAQDPVGGLSARIDLAPATPPAAPAAATTAPAAATTAAAAATTAAAAATTAAAAAVTMVFSPTRPAPSAVRDDSRTRRDGHEAPDGRDGRDGRDD